MEDAIRATIELMEAPLNEIKIRSAYNLAGISFTPKMLSEEIKKHISNFEMNCEPDFRQQIADSWPDSIDDSVAQKDWAWKAKFDLPKMVIEMLKNVDVTKLN